MSVVWSKLTNFRFLDGNTVTHASDKQPDSPTSPPVAFETSSSLCGAVRGSYVRVISRPVTAAQALVKDNDPYGWHITCTRCMKSIEKALALEAELEANRVEAQRRRAEQQARQQAEAHVAAVQERVLESLERLYRAVVDSVVKPEAIKPSLREALEDAWVVLGEAVEREVPDPPVYLVSP